MQQCTDDFKPFLTASAPDAVTPAIVQPGVNAAEAKDAVAGAAITVLNKLFKSTAKRDAGVFQQSTSVLGDFVDVSIRSYQQVHTIRSNSAAYTCGVAIAGLILDQLEIKANEPGVDAANYVPTSREPYWFDDDPSHPNRRRPIDPDAPECGLKITRPYHGPYYGTSAAIFATTKDIKIADPPINPSKPRRSGC